VPDPDLDAGGGLPGGPAAAERPVALEAVFADAGIEKVFHAAEYDVMTLKRDFDFRFANIFDTMVAARVLGKKKVGLGSILESEFGVKPDKRYQRANWGQRPLPRDLLKYAQLDTHYLIPLRERLRAELKASDRWALAKEDFRRVCQVASFGFNNGRQDGVWRIAGSYDLHPQTAAILHELAAYREQRAQVLDRPLFKVINDQTLLDIALVSPQDLNELSKIRGMSRGQIERHGEELLKAVKRGMKAEPIFPPRSPRPDGAYLERMERLRQWRKRTARRIGVESDVVLPRDLMNAIASQNPKGRPELAKILADVPWRLEEFGEELLQVVRG
jgi:ribonuclease D